MAQTQKTQDSNNYDIVLVGGGSAGITTAARLVKQLGRENLSARILVIDPSENHYYQPIWTLVGGGVYPREVSRKKERDLIPHGVAWLQEEVCEFIQGELSLSGGMHWVEAGLEENSRTGRERWQGRSMQQLLL